MKILEFYQSKKFNQLKKMLLTTDILKYFDCSENK